MKIDKDASNGFLEDSSPLLSDKNSLLNKFSNDGYLYFKHFIKKEEITNLYQSITEAMAEINLPITFRDKMFEEEKIIIKNILSNFFINIQKNELFHNLSYNSNIINIMKTLLGSEIFQLPRKFARIILPIKIDSTSTVLAHQDFSVIKGTVDALTIWIPLMDCNHINGGLRILKGSHKFGLLPMTKTGILNDIAKEYKTDLNDIDKNWLSSYYEVGDVLIFHSLTVHEALPNISDNMRISVDYRYQSLNDPVDIYSLTAPFRCETDEQRTNPNFWSFDKQFSLPSGLRVLNSKISNYILKENNIWVKSKYYKEYDK